MNQFVPGYPMQFRDTLGRLAHPALVAGGYDADAQAVIDAYTSTPDSPHQDAINALVVALKSAGIWSKLDVLYIHATSEETGALVNWINPGTYDATNHGATFTADSGFTGDGSSAYIDTGWKPDGLGNYTIYDASLFAWNLVTTTTGGFASIRNGSVIIPRWLGGANTRMYMNVLSSAAQFGDTDNAAFYHGVRESDDVLRTYKNGSLQVSNTGTVTEALPSIDSLQGLREGSGTFSDGEIAVLGAGAGMDATEAAALHSALSTYLTTVGAI